MPREKQSIAAGILLCSVTALTLLSECARAPWSDSTISGSVETEYNGFNENFVRSCVAIATNTSLRNDRGIPYRITVSDIEQQQRVVEAQEFYDVQGSKDVYCSDSANPDEYSWTCVATFASAHGLFELTASLTNFEKK